MSTTLGPLTKQEDLTATWPLNRLQEAVNALRQTRKAGWTPDEKVELLRQRWLADARRAPLIANIQGRTASSAWPQLTRIRRDVGDELFMLGQQRMDDTQRAQFISGLEHSSAPSPTLISVSRMMAAGEPSVLSVASQPCEFLDGHDESDLAESKKAVIAIAAFVQGLTDTQAVTPSPRAPTPPLHAAVERSDTDECRRLLIRGVNVNKLDADKWTALHLACEQGDVGLVRLLLEHGADTSIPGQNDDCALHYLSSSGANMLSKVEVAKIVIAAHVQKCGDINVMNDSDETPLDEAIRHECHEIASLLQLHGAVKGALLPQASKRKRCDDDADPVYDQQFAAALAAVDSGPAAVRKAAVTAAAIRARHVPTEPSPEDHRLAKSYYETASHELSLRAVMCEGTSSYAQAALNVAERGLKRVPDHHGLSEIARMARNRLKAHGGPVSILDYESRKASSARAAAQGEL